MLAIRSADMAVVAATATKVAGVIREGGGVFVDGGIVGGPAWKCGPQGPNTRLYLSGDGADGVADLFRGTNLGAEVVPPPTGGIPPGGTDTGASAMKIAYASWTKGSAALLINVNAYVATMNSLLPFVTPYYDVPSCMARSLQLCESSRCAQHPHQGMDNG